MKLYEQYPERVTLPDGREYALDLDFKTVLRALDVQTEDCWTPLEKLELQCQLLLGDPSECPPGLQDRADLLSAIYALFPKPEEEGRERYLDFEQDAAKIRSGFFRLGIDLTTARMHFFRFLELLADLPEDSALMRTIEIRQRPIPKPTKTNGEQIAALQKAKARVALKISEEERRRTFARALKNSTNLRG